MNCSEADDRTDCTKVATKLAKCTRLCVFCGKMFARLNDHQKGCRHGNPEKSNSIEPTVPFVCVRCGKLFSFKSGLHRHEQFCKRKNSEFHKCENCYSVFSRIDNFKNHMRKCSKNNLNIKNAHRFQCMYENCSAVFFHKNKLTLHLKQFHDCAIEEEQVYDFQNIEDFLKWKHTEEEKTHSCFTKNSGTKGTNSYYHCQHDGSSRPHCKMGDVPRKTLRRVKKGVVKQDKVCLAKISVKMLDGGTCKVVYQPTHSHELNMKLYHKSPLLTETVKFINHQLAMGVAPKDCFKDLSDGSFHRKSNDTLISVQEGKPLFVSNAKSLPHIKRMKIINTKDDPISIMIRAALLLKEDPNPIILYKPLGASKVIGPSKIDKLPNAKEIFMLGIQTKEQRSMMVSGVKNILSISICNGTNVYGYPLLTLVVPDRHNRAYPVGFFISSCMDYNSISCFFEALKSNCQDLHNINCVIVPQNSFVYNALKDELQLDTLHIWCLWDLHQELQNVLVNLVPESIVQEVYNFLCLIIDCKDRNEVKDLINRFVTEYSVNAPEFVTYFKDHYLLNNERWTMAYRDFQHGNVNTTILNEKVHNRIKQKSIDKLNNQRLDELINTLFDLEEEDYKKQATEEMLGVPFGIGDIATCHTNSLKIPDNNIVQIHDTLWEINTIDESYTKCIIVKCSDDCISVTCCFVCNAKECNNLCSHMFACTCPDKNPLCKHIHKVQTFVSRNKVPLPIVEPKHVVEESSSQTITDKNASQRLKKINGYTKHLLALIEEQKIPVPFIKRIETCLEEFVNESHSLLPAELEHTGSNHFEFEYEVEKFSTANSMNHNSISNNSNSAFTPSFDFSKLNKAVLKCRIEELSFSNLKLLDPHLTFKEILNIQQNSNDYTEWMHPTVVNAFSYELQLCYNRISIINTDIAFSLLRNNTSKVLHTQTFLEKDILIVPMNLSYNYWTCIAAFRQRKELIYFNSKEKMSKVDKMVMLNLQAILAKNEFWKVTLANYDFQDDGTSCGVQMCHFMEQIAMDSDLTPLIDVHMYRKHIYNTIVGNCLKRNHYSDTVCGSCMEYVCTSVDDETAQLLICCDKCNQWFHIHCIGLQAMDITNMRFTCPALNK